MGTSAKNLDLVADTLEIRLNSGEIAYAIIQSGRSELFVLSADEISSFAASPRFPESARLSSQTSESNQATIRLIGAAESIRPLTQEWIKQGYRVGKDVPLEESQRTFHFLPLEGRIRIFKKDLATTPATQKKLKVLVVDDSETIRKVISKIIADDPRLECVGTISTPVEAEDAIKKYKPDVLTLDIHMPVMNGVELLRKILPLYPIPTVMISALSKEDGSYVLEAMEAGAVDYIQKPSLKEISQMGPVICEKIFNASKAQVRTSPVSRTHTKFMGDLDLRSLIVIGSSTGGTEALREVLTAFPESIPPVLIVQHIPPVFSKAFADRMNQLVSFEVREATDGELVKPNQVLIAPGGRQMSVKERNGELHIVISDAPPVNRHKPSVDFLFDSVAALKRKKVVAAILTGMGADGAKGLLNLRNSGARTFGQDEATCVVYGMPREAFEQGGVENVVPLQEMANAISKSCALKPPSR